MSDEPTPELIDQLYREEVLGARRMTLTEKFLAGPQLFEYACSIARDGIRMQHPDYTNEQVEQELNRRLEIGRRLEDIH